MRDRVRILGSTPSGKRSKAVAMTGEDGDKGAGPVFCRLT